MKTIAYIKKNISVCIQLKYIQWFICENCRNLIDNNIKLINYFDELEIDLIRKSIFIWKGLNILKNIKFNKTIRNDIYHDLEKIKYKNLKSDSHKIFILTMIGIINNIVEDIVIHNEKDDKIIQLYQRKINFSNKFLPKKDRYDVTYDYSLYEFRFRHNKYDNISYGIPKEINELISFKEGYNRIKSIDTNIKYLREKKLIYTRIVAIFFVRKQLNYYIMINILKYLEINII